MMLKRLIPLEGTALLIAGFLFLFAAYLSTIPSNGNATLHEADISAAHTLFNDSYPGKYGNGDASKETPPAFSVINNQELPAKNIFLGSPFFPSPEVLATGTVLTKPYLAAHESSSPDAIPPREDMLLPAHSTPTPVVAIIPPTITTELVPTKTKAKDSDSPPTTPLSPIQSPGGFIDTDTEARARLSQSVIQSFLPARGTFTFPAPYNTTGVRLTNADDCGGNDCVDYIGYSYWHNINNHKGSDVLYAFVGLNRAKGGEGPTLFQYNKTNGDVKKIGPLFDSESVFSWYTGEQWYFSGTAATKLYVFQAGGGSKLLRYDILSKNFETVFDAADSDAGGNTYIWQPHSSDDDRVHIATLRDRGNYQMLGCIVYEENGKKFSYYPEKGNLDECNLDKSGKWLIMLDDVDYANGLDNRIIEIATGKEKLLMDEKGGAGHLDMGYGVIVGEDNWGPYPAGVRLYNLGSTSIAGLFVYKATDWSVGGHISFGNAENDIPLEKQYACGSYVQRGNALRGNEIVCFLLDGSFKTLVVAPVMTDLNASGGGDDYAKSPKGNLDRTGQYFIWTSNMGSSRQDVFIVKVPGQLLLK
jgi:hypothetical protein